MHKLFNKIFGRKYYIVLARNRGTLREFVCGHIFGTWEAAYTFCSDLQFETRTDMGLEVHSFRTHKHITTYEETV